MPRRATIPASRSITAACVVTSSPVVGSSAISSRGEQAMATAIITRWHMPPDSSCGYASSRAAAFRICTASSSSSARPRASPHPTASCARMASAICSPTGRIGFSAARGFWKIMLIAAPRSPRMVRREAPTRSRPSHRMRPPLTRPARSSSPVAA